MTSHPSLQSAHYRYADNDAPFRFRHRRRRDLLPTFLRLLLSIWRHRNEQRRKRHGQTTARLLWPFGSVQCKMQTLGLLVSSSRSTVKEVTSQFRTDPAPPSSDWWRGQQQIPSERLQIIYEIGCIGLRELFARKFFKQTRNVNNDSPEASCINASCGLEGLASKRRHRPHHARRSKHWMKIKNGKRPAMD